MAVGPSASVHTTAEPTIPTVRVEPSSEDGGSQRNVTTIDEAPEAQAAAKPEAAGEAAGETPKRRVKKKTTEGKTVEGKVKKLVKKSKSHDTAEGEKPKKKKKKKVLHTEDGEEVLKGEGDAAEGMSEAPKEEQGDNGIPSAWRDEPETPENVRSAQHEIQSDAFMYLR